jgi:hypothetical protein
MRWLVAVGVLVLACSHEEPPSLPGPPPPSAIDVEAVAMASALRAYYPVVRVVDDSFEPAVTCSKGAKGNKPAIAKCIDLLDDVLAKAAAALPRTASLSDCALVVGKACAAAITAAQAEKGMDPRKRRGISFGDMHDAMAPCAAKLFRVGMNSPGDAAKPSQVEGHLGLRDDEEPGPATYAKNRAGHLWTATGREIDRATLELR